MAGKDSSGGMDAANLLKPLLARGKLRCIGATTLGEYRNYIEKDSAFERRFQTVTINEPSVPETISILRGIKDKYEVHHGVTILDSALVSAATLAHRYLTSRKLPDSAIDLVDEAASAVRIARDSSPEQIDQLERHKLQLEVEVKALSKEKDEASKERMEKAQHEIRSINDQLAPLKAAYEASKQAAQNIQSV
jgi:ATP-dependent Clp protease ATP-binding subunit ClpB